MSFSIPTFNLPCRIFTGNNALPPTGPPRVLVNCNLALGRSARVDVWIPFSIVRRNRPLSMSTPAFFPAGTDVRDDSSATGFDLIEVPALSGRFYWVTFVDDVGKGFDNEHRLAILQKVWNYGSFFGLVPQWPTPFP